MTMALCASCRREMHPFEGQNDFNLCDRCACGAPPSQASADDLPPGARPRTVRVQFVEDGTGRVFSIDLDPTEAVALHGLLECAARDLNLSVRPRGQLLQKLVGIRVERVRVGDPPPDEPTFITTNPQGKPCSPPPPP
jgi:hypothetical protein